MYHVVGVVVVVVCEEKRQTQGQKDIRTHFAESRHDRCPSDTRQIKLNWLCN